MEEISLPIILQKWEGHVTKVKEETFIAILTKLVGEGGDVEAEIWKSAVEPESQERIQEGATLHWIIGYASQEAKEKDEGTSIIWFDEVHYWTEEEIESAKLEGERLYRLMNGEDNGY